MSGSMLQTGREQVEFEVSIGKCDTIMYEEHNWCLCIYNNLTTYNKLYYHWFLK